MPWIYLIVLFIIKQQFNDVDKRAQIWYAIDLFDYFIHYQTTIQWCRQAGPDMICHGFIWLFYSSSNNNSMMPTSGPRYDMPWIYLIILFITKQQFNDADKRAQIWYAMHLFDYFIPHQTTIQWCRQAGPDMICHRICLMMYFCILFVDTLLVIDLCLGKINPRNLNY